MPLVFQSERFFRETWPQISLDARRLVVAARK
jgi:hypothetical protein